MRHDAALALAFCACRHVTRVLLHVAACMQTTCAWARSVMLYRLGFCSLLHAAFQNLRYCLQFLFFFNGISFHISVAFASHLLGYEMQWGITAKAREVSLSSCMHICCQVPA